METYLESAPIYCDPSGLVDLTPHARMFVSILENPDIRFWVKHEPPSDRLCDICFKEKVENGTTSHPVYKNDT